MTGNPAKNRRPQEAADDTIGVCRKDLAEWDNLWTNWQNCSSKPGKESFESDLVKCSNKLNAHRKALTSFASDKMVKDKSGVLDVRRQLEMRLESFDAQRSGLTAKKGAFTRLANSARDGGMQACTDWIGECMSSLNVQVEGITVELECMGPNKDGQGATRLKSLLEHNRWHLMMLQRLHRKLSAGGASVEQVETSLKDNLDHYIKSFVEEDVFLDTHMYDEFDLDSDHDKENAANAILTPGLGSPLKDEGFKAVIPPKMTKAQAKALARKSSISSGPQPVTPSVPANSVWADPSSSMSASRGLGLANAGSKTMAQIMQEQAEKGSRENSEFRPEERLKQDRERIDRDAREQQGRELRAAMGVGQSAAGQSGQNREMAPKTIMPRPVKKEEPSDAMKLAEAGLAAQAAKKPSLELPRPSPAGPKGGQLLAPKLPPPEGPKSAMAKVTGLPAPKLPGKNAMPPKMAPPPPPGKGLPKVPAPTSGPPSSAPPPAPAARTPPPSMSPPAAPPLEASKGLMTEEARAVAALELCHENFVPVIESMRTESVGPVFRPNNQHPWSHPGQGRQWPYPEKTAAGWRDPKMFEKLDLDTLFFIFYHQPGTYQQYLAAKELKKKSWRYHIKFETWFQRHCEPVQTLEDGEKGDYIYFDHQTSWLQRIKHDFIFDYEHLEDESGPPSPPKPSYMCLGSLPFVFERP